MTKLKKWLMGVSIFALLIFGYIWNEEREAKALHMMQTPEDIAFEQEMVSKLQKGSVDLKAVISGGWDEVCIVPSYRDINSIPLSAKAREELSFLNENPRMFMKYENKTTYQVWWLFTLKSGRPEFIYRGSSRLRLEPEGKEQCMGKENAIFYRKKIMQGSRNNNAVYATTDKTNQ